MSRDKSIMLTLRDVLEYYCTDTLPDKWTAWDDIRPNTVYRVRLAFMSEDETHVETYPTHPMLIPWYACPVDSFDVDGKDTLRVWLRYERYVPTLMEG